MTSSAPTTPRPGIDPRLRARRVAVRRAEGRRRLRRAAALAAVAVAVALAVALTRSPLLDVDRVRVEGATHTTPAAVRRAAGVDLGDPLLYVDLGAVQRSVASLPWVAAVDVRRSWPGTVRVTVRERSAVAAVPDGDGGWLLADGDGRLLERVDDPPDELPRMLGVTPADGVGAAVPADARAALHVLARLPTALEGRVVAATVAGSEIDLEVRVGEQARAIVHFGAPDQTAAKLVALATILGSVDATSLAVIDVRVPEVPVVTRKP